jgi:hypothetical protein
MELLVKKSMSGRVSTLFQKPDSPAPVQFFILPALAQRHRSPSIHRMADEGVAEQKNNSAESE